MIYIFEIMALPYRITVSESGQPDYSIKVANNAVEVPIMGEVVPENENANNAPAHNEAKIESPRDLQEALDNGRDFDPLELVRLLQGLKITPQQEEVKSETEFERTPGLMCDSATKKYYLSDHSLISGLMNDHIVRKRITVLQEIMALKKIGYTRDMIVKNPRNIPDQCDRCDNNRPTVVTIGNYTMCKECANHYCPAYDKETIVLVGDNAFGADVKCKICEASQAFYAVPNACGCIAGREPYCEGCYVNWCKAKFGARPNNDDDDDEFHEYDGSVLVPCPFCNQKFIPF